MTEQVVAWVLHALEPDEEMAVRPHLARCPSCRKTVGDAELVLGGLATTPRQIDPPPRLRDEILTMAAQTPQDSPQRNAGRRPVSPAVAEVAPIFARHRIRRLGSGGRRLLIAAAVLGAIVAGGTGAYTAQVQAQHDAEVSQTRALADIVVALGQPGVPHATLSTASGKPVAAVVDSGGQRAVVAAGLTPNNPNTIYVVWGISAAGPRPIGTFDVAATGADVHAMDCAASTQPFAGYAISLEPGRTAPAAPTTLVASGPIET